MSLFIGMRRSRSLLRKKNKKESTSERAFSECSAWMPEAVGLECTDKVSDLVEFVKQVPSDPGMQSLQDGIQYFEEAVPIVIKALDNVAKIHPFIGSESKIIRLNYRSQALSRSVCF